MEITNKQELQQASNKASELIQSIHNYCVENKQTIADVPEARVRFPRGFIRPAAHQRKRFSFLANSDLKSNIAYTLMLSDTIMWLAARTDISGTARDMLYKLFTFLIGSVLESTSKEYLKGICGKGFKERNAYMHKHGIISKHLQKELNWVWDTRNRMHLFQLNNREWINDYDINNHRRAIQAFRDLLEALSNHRK